MIYNVIGVSIVNSYTIWKMLNYIYLQIQKKLPKLTWKANDQQAILCLAIKRLQLIVSNA